MTAAKKGLTFLLKLTALVFQRKYIAKIYITELAEEFHTPRR